MLDGMTLVAVLLLVVLTLAIIPMAIALAMLIGVVIVMASEAIYKVVLYLWRLTAHARP